jgi:hypothetical protein
MATLPGYFGIGLKSAVNDLSWMTGSGIPWDYRYQYFNVPDWEGWASPGGGQFASNYVSDSLSNSYVPVITRYGASIANLQNASYANSYYADYVLLLQKIHGWYNWNTVSANNNYLTLSADNVTVTDNNTTLADQMAVSGNSRSAGKYTFEFTIIANNSTHLQVGLAYPGAIYNPNYLGANNGSAGIGVGGLFINNQVVATTPALSYASGDRVDIAVDFDAKLIWSRKNGGVWNNSSTASPSTGTGGASIATLSTAHSYAPAASLYAPGDQVSVNLAAPPALSGFTTWNDATTLAKPIVVHIEPDLWGYMQQGYGDDPTQVPISVASSGFTGLGALPNNAAGFAQALVSLRNTYTPNVILAWHASFWGPNNGYDPTLSNPQAYQTPQATGGRVATFYNALGAPFDMIFHDPSDADSAYKVIVRGQTPTGNGGAWWFPAAFASYEHYIAAVYSGTGLNSMLWQVPVGNTLYDTCNNTSHHFQDNRPEYFLASGSGWWGSSSATNIDNYIGAGVIGLLIGDGQSLSNPATTDYEDAAGDGITNPLPLSSNGNPVNSNPNNLVSSYSDDDGGFLRLSAQAYYVAGPISISAPASQPPTFAIGATVETTTTAHVYMNKPLSKPYKTEPAGMFGTINDGPTVAGGYTWWSVRFSNASGWVVQNQLTMQ